MLFLYRPRQTWMPYPVPRNMTPQGLTRQGVYNRQLQEKFDATVRVPRQAPAGPAAVPATRSASSLPEALQQLGALHTSGVLSDTEFAAAKAKLIGSGEQPA